MLVLLHTVSKIGMYGLLYILTYSLKYQEFVKIEFWLFLIIAYTIN